MIFLRAVQGDLRQTGILRNAPWVGWIQDPVRARPVVDFKPVSACCPGTRRNPNSFSRAGLHRDHSDPARRDDVAAAETEPANRSDRRKKMIFPGHALGSSFSCWAASPPAVAVPGSPTNTINLQSSNLRVIAQPGLPARRSGQYPRQPQPGRQVRGQVMIRAASGGAAGRP